MQLPRKLIHQRRMDQPGRIRGHYVDTFNCCRFSALKIA